MPKHIPTLERAEAYLHRVGEHMAIPPVVRVDDAVCVGPYRITIEPVAFMDGHIETRAVVSRELPTVPLHRLATHETEYDAVCQIAQGILLADMPHWVFADLTNGTE